MINSLQYYKPVNSYDELDQNAIFDGYCFDLSSPGGHEYFFVLKNCKWSTESMPLIKHATTIKKVFDHTISCNLDYCNAIINIDEYDIAKNRYITIINTKDEMIIESLKKLGWTPPKE